MGGSESHTNNYIKQYGVDALIRCILLKQKINWLEGTCMRHINKKVDDQVKYILFQMDEFIDGKKSKVLHMYVKVKSDIVDREGTKVKSYEQQHGRSLENIYGKNHFLDKLNSLKVHFHIQVHIIKKSVKKLVEQKIKQFENELFCQSQSVLVSKNNIQQIFIQKDNKKYTQILKQRTPELNQSLEVFKKEIIALLSFERIFWPFFDQKIRQTKNQVNNVFNEVQKVTKNLNPDAKDAWNLLFNF